MRRRRHGFTVLEVLLALALGSLVIGAALGVYQILLASDRLGAERLEEAADIAVTQNIIRRVLGNLVAARPIDPASLENLDETTEADGGDDDDQPEADPPDDLPEGLEAPDDPEAEGMLEAIVPTVAPGTPVMFELFWETFPDGVQAQAIEVVVAAPPVNVAEIPSGRLIDKRDDMEEELHAAGRVVRSVRGRLEIAEYADGWVLQWRQTAPAAEPFVLLRGVEWLEWEALPESREVDAWHDVHSAFLTQDFPAALRLRLWTDSAAHEDWLFEPIVTNVE